MIYQLILKPFQRNLPTGEELSKQLLMGVLNVNTIR